jgi:hypothetical protein
MDDLYNDASKVTAEDGTVKVKGPDGVDVRLTVEAALETSDRLLDGAVEANGQRVDRERRGPVHPVPATDVDA